MSLAQVVYCALMALLALAGLAAASAARDPGFALFGYALLAFGIAKVFVLIHRATGAPEG